MRAGILGGYGVVNTRPVPQAAELTAAIEAAGGHAIDFPVLDIAARARDDLLAESRVLDNPDIVIYVSRNAVSFGSFIGAESNAKIGAIGPSTAAALDDAGIEVSFGADRGFDSESLLADPTLADPRDKTVTIVRGSSGRELLADELKARGARVQYLSAYERMPHQPTSKELAALQTACENGSASCIVIMSVESLKCWRRIIPDACYAATRNSLLVTPSRRVLQTATELVPDMDKLQISRPATIDIVNELGAHLGSDSYS